MKIKFDVTVEEFQIVRDVLSSYLSDECKVWVFGSRAKNTARFNSDLDLAIACPSKLPQKTLSKLKEDFDDAKIAFSVDIVDMNAVEPYFKNIIDTQKVPFPLKPKTPKLRFKEFSGEWEEKKIAELDMYISDGNYGEMYPKADEMKDFGVPFIRANNIKNLKLVWDDMKYIDKELHSVLLSGHLKAEDILVTTRGDIGMVAYVTEEFDGANINAQICLLRCRGNLNSYYVMQYLASNIGLKQFKELQTGTALKQLPKKNLGKVKIAYPDKSEQQKIATFLTAIDTKIDQLTKKQTLLKQYKKGVMQKLFSQELRFKADEGSEFPEWEEKTLGEIAEKQTRKNKDNAINNVFSNSAVQGIVNQRDYFDKDIANQNNLLNYYIIEKDDFIYNPRISNFAPVGPIGRNHLGLGVMSPLYSVFKIKQGNLDFFEQYFLTSHWYEYMESIANYGARADRMNITSSGFYLMPLPFPSLEEQTKIVNFLTAIDTKIIQRLAQGERLKQFKKGLLQQMFV